MRGALALALVLAFVASPCAAQTTPVKYASAATNNATLVKAGRVTLGSVSVANSVATVYYLKLYDKVTAPTCGTDTPRAVIQVPASAPASVPVGAGINFNAGLGFCLVAGIADSDNASAATGLVINLGLTGR